MKLGFFGSHHAFDYGNIGGTDSIIRRLAHSLIAYPEMAEISLVTYGHKKLNHQEHSPGITSNRYIDLANSLEHLERFDHIVSLYLPPRDRLKYARFRQARNKSQVFHMLYQSWPEARWRRELSFADAMMFPFNGHLFGVSPRLVKRLGKISQRAALLWPPVPQSYYASDSTKTLGEQLRITFLGRTDPGKGAIETAQLFRLLSAHDNIELNFYGMHWPHYRESVELHKRLSEQVEFKYHHVDFRGFTPEVEKKVSQVLLDTDIFVQPYRVMSSTIDTPLLILEAMASQAAILTKPLGQLSSIYGESPFLIESFHDLHQVAQVILGSHDKILAERERIKKQSNFLGFDTTTVSKNLLRILLNGQS